MKDWWRHSETSSKTRTLLFSEVNTAGAYFVYPEKNLSTEECNKGVEITFQEFVNYILKKKVFDEHWDLMTKLCSPCSHKYDYIGKMETLTEDSVANLKNAHLNEKFHFPLNASDCYLSKSSDIMRKYISNLTKTEIEQLYKLYEDDFLAFGYTLPVLSYRPIG